MAQSNSRSIHGIDMVRFAAALAVAAYHLAYKSWTEPYPGGLAIGDTNLPPWWEITCFDWIGVQVFFVISGFVIAYSSEHATPFGFIRSRIVRLGPALWISAAICAGILLVSGMPAAGVVKLYVKTALFAPIGPWISGQYWTLGVEVAFYATVALLLAAGAFDRLVTLTCAIAMASATYWAAVELRLWPVDLLPRVTALLLLQHGCYFALGTCFWLIMRYGLTQVHLLVIALCCTTALPQIAVTCAYENTDPALTRLWWIPYLIWLGTVAAIASFIRFQAPVQACLGNGTSAVRQIGLATYPLYLLHDQAGSAMLSLGVALGLPPGVNVLLALAVCVGIALVVSAMLEPPLRTWTYRAVTWLRDRLVAQWPVWLRLGPG